MYSGISRISNSKAKQWEEKASQNGENNSLNGQGHLTSTPQLPVSLAVYATLYMLDCRLNEK
jgi:hypothetical protein